MYQSLAGVDKSMLTPTCRMGISAWRMVSILVMIAGEPVVNAYGG
jgi:hypothetical protein